MRKSILQKLLVSSALLTINLAPAAYSQEVPEDLIGDEHVREEFGISKFTTPSIKKLFEDLEDLGQLPYDQLKRDYKAVSSRDRTVLALNLGILISDGFLVVQSEQVIEVKTVGKEVLKQARALGSGMRVQKHTKTLIEKGGLGEWDSLKDELAKTQADVEAEMVMLRDSDIAHLVALGGWLRAFEIVATTSTDPFSAKKASKLQRPDLVMYFHQSLEGIYSQVFEKGEPKLEKHELIQKLTVGLGEMNVLLERPEGEKLDEETTLKLLKKCQELIALINKPAKSS